MSNRLVSQDDGTGQGGLYKKNYQLAAKWAGYRKAKLSGSQLRLRLAAKSSTDKEIMRKLFKIN